MTSVVGARHSHGKPWDWKQLAANVLPPPLAPWQNQIVTFDRGGSQRSRRDIRCDICHDLDGLVRMPRLYENVYTVEQRESNSKFMEVLLNSNHTHPSFNLWSDPWITAERPDGTLDSLSIAQTLTHATDYRMLYDPSPLVMVSIHRLLVAILQDIFRPKKKLHLKTLWEAEAFSAAEIERFGDRYADRFDIFSADHPFMQSADIPLVPEKRGKGKSIGYLFQEENAGTGVTHYNHSYDADHRFCPICSAKGLVFIPAFASSGGAGIKPSINGVPPIYILPGGETLFNSLVASLTVPSYQPEAASDEVDTPWWRRDSHDLIVKKKGVVREVGYLHSLTFPARRMRLYPEIKSGDCSRCGQTADLLVQEISFEMGEERPKKAPLWRDPFAAYKVRKDDEAPIPIRPIAGKVTWREYQGLFLPTKLAKGKAGKRRPKIVNQLADLEDSLPYGRGVPYPFYVIGVRTDMKAKTFEWTFSGFQVPPKLLTDAEAANKIQAGIDFAEAVDGILKKMFSKYFGGDGKSKRDENTKWRMSQSYWSALTADFYQMIEAFGEATELDSPFHQWLDQVQAIGIDQFKQHVKLVGRGSADLRKRVEAINHNRATIYAHRKKNYAKPEVTT